MKPSRTARRQVLWLLLLSGLFQNASAQAVSVQVVGLFPGAAVLLIDGERKLLKAGRSQGPVTLVSATGRQAVVEVDGERRTLSLSRAHSQGYTQAEKKVVRLIRNNDGHYWVSGKINGRAVRMMVDTGASDIAIGKAEADRLGLNYQDGEQVYYSTANGATKGFVINLGAVTVNGITLRNIRASVIPNNNTVLLGMSFLRGVNMREENNILYLTPRY